MWNHAYIKIVLVSLFSVLSLIIPGCIKTSNNDSPYPIRYCGSDSIKQIESVLSYCGITLGMAYSRDSLEKNNWRFIDTYFKQYNPEKNNYVGSFHTDVHSEFEDRLDPNSAHCSIYRTLNENLVYEIDVTVNRRDTAMVNTYLSKYGENNAIKYNNDHWEWEYKNQTINLWLRPDYTSVVYRDSTAIRIHEEEIDSIQQEYIKALKDYKEKEFNKI